MICFQRWHLRPNSLSSSSSSFLCIQYNKQFVTLLFKKKPLKLGPIQLHAISILVHLFISVKLSVTIRFDVKYIGWFFSFGTKASVLSCNNVGRCHFYRRLLTIPSLRAHDLLLKTLSRLPSTLFAPSTDLAMPIGSNNFCVTGHTL